MQKQTGAILLISGTCIGSGMIALPMVLARIGIIPSIFLMLLMWSIIYYSALINLEISLQAKKALSLGELGRKFSGKIAELIGTSSFKVLSYALVSVYIYAGSSVLEKMLLNSEINFPSTISAYALVAAILLTLPIKFIDYVNRLLFMGLLVVIAFLVAGLIIEINWSNLPLFAQEYKNISAWIIIAPVVFTAFGFHGSLPTLINYCNSDAKILKKAFLWGCCIPSIVYIVWTFSILGVIHNNNPNLYQQMIIGKVEVGDLIRELSLIIHSKSVQLLIWWISLLAIVTSLLGVGVSLCGTIRNTIAKKISNTKLAQVTASILTIFPAYLMAIWVPNAFKKIKITTLYCPELKYSLLINSTALVGVLIILSELLNML